MPERSFQIRVMLLFFALLLGLSAVAARLITLQVSASEQEGELTNQTYTTTRILPHMRGKIVDRNGEILAFDRPITSVICDKIRLLGKRDKSKINDNDMTLLLNGLAYREATKEEGFSLLKPAEQRKRLKKLWRVLRNDLSNQEIINEHFEYALVGMARPLGYTIDELRDKIINGPSGQVVLARELSQDVAEQLEMEMDDARVQGFIFKKSRKRSYTMPDLAPHTIGYISEIDDEVDGEAIRRMAGVFGVEGSCDRYLTGRDGKRIFQRDRSGMPISTAPGQLLPPSHGLNVQLTLDHRIQAIAEEELLAAVIEAKASRGTIIILRPQSGELLGLANYPSFDLNTKGNLSEASLNYALQGTYEPGSTFKIVATGGALDMGFVTPESEIFCHNRYYRKGPIVVKDHSSLGMATVRKIIAKSSNIGTYQMALMLDADQEERAKRGQNFGEYIRRFGFGTKTGIALPHERGGLITDVRNPTNLSRLAYGYSINVTPLQVAMAYGAVANGGVLMQPQVVKSITTPSGGVVKQAEPQVVRRVMKEETAESLRSILQGVIAPHMTGRRAMVLGFTSGGKTGTASKLGPDGKYLEKRNVVSFAGMVPAMNPEFVCVIVIDDPMTTEVPRFGGSIAAPVFSRVSQRVALSLNLLPDREEASANP